MIQIMSVILKLHNEYYKGGKGDDLKETYMMEKKNFPLLKPDHGFLKKREVLKLN